MALGRLALLAVLCSVSARQMSNKDWAKMNDKDWDRVFDEWEDEDEKEEYAYKPPKPKGGGIDMEKLTKFKGNPKVRAGRSFSPVQP